VGSVAVPGPRRIVPGPGVLPPAVGLDGGARLLGAEPHGAVGGEDGGLVADGEDGGEADAEAAEAAVGAALGEASVTSAWTP
jgi:hypothetical protein